MSRSLDRAESAGLVLRQADPYDRRAQQVTLTKKGEQTVQAFTPHLLEVLDQTVYGVLTDEYVETFVELLGRVSSSARHLLETRDHTPKQP